MNPYEISRRRFLQVTGATMAGAALAGMHSRGTGSPADAGVERPDADHHIHRADSQGLR